VANRKRFYVYVLESLTDRMSYIGHTDDLSNRLIEHNSGRCRFTKGHQPWEIIYRELASSRSEAIKRERFLKSGIGRDTLRELIKRA
jgi:putative endonuclease